jgi:NAD(P)-dependent dehydrogenase (short-subunit alcohol dehydrogenase family)
MEAVFAGKQALVIGGSGGIGRSIALGLAEKGAVITITGGNSPERLSSALTELNTVSGGHSGFLCRIGSPDGLSPEKAAAFILEKTDCDILVITWGPYKRQTLEETKPEDWRTLTENNLIFPGIVVSSILKDMIRKKWGRILLFGGTKTSEIRGFSSTAAYGAAKTALGVLAKSAVKSVKNAEKEGKGIPMDITCNVLCPGLTKTEYTTTEEDFYYQKNSPGGKVLTSKEIAHCALALLENSTINGIIIRADRGIWI